LFQNSRGMIKSIVPSLLGHHHSLFLFAQFVLPQPTDVVLLQTNCVKCPVVSLNPGFAQSYCSLSRPHASMAAEAFA
jgi:hypothetical protein